MIDVACVLRSGGAYDPRWVHRLREAVARYLPIEHRFVCLSDVPVGGDIVRYALPAGWRGWWAKQALYQPGLFPGRVLYLDLDSLIVGDLSELAAYNGLRAVLSDFNQPAMIGTGMMMWWADAMEDVFRHFIVDPGKVMAAYPRRSDHFTTQAMRTPADRIQSLYPGQVVSSKRHCRQGPPAGARVICMHGRPRLTDLAPDHWMRLTWEGRVYA